MNKNVFFLLCLILTFPTPSFAEKNHIVLALGDSLTEGYGVSKEDAYPAQLELLLKKSHITVINAGISGSTSASGESRLRWQLKNKPDLLLLALGANDGLRGLPVKAMQDNLEKVITLAQSQKIIIILAGMKIPMNYGEPYRMSYEKVFSDLAQKHKLIFVPFLLEGVGGHPELNIADGIHPNSKGHIKIAQSLAPYIEKALKGL